jgi:hypothetical protein
VEVLVSTRWSWIPVDGRRALVLRHVDPSAGPSVKGALVDDPPTEQQIRDAIGHPDRTFRDPARFGAIAIGAAEALRLGLPKDPPWIGLFADSTQAQAMALMQSPRTQRATSRR